MPLRHGAFVVAAAKALFAECGDTALGSGVHTSLEVTLNVISFESTLFT